MLKMLSISVVTGNYTQCITARSDQSLLESLHGKGFNIPAPCAGTGSCGKCGIRVLRGSLAPSAADLAFYSRDKLERGYRLSCAAYPKEPLFIEIISPLEEAFAPVGVQAATARPDMVRVDEVELRRSEESIAVQAAREGGEPLTQAALGDCSKIAEQGGAERIYVCRYEKSVVRVDTSPGDYYAVGVDIGTTTLGFGLVNLLSGEIAALSSSVNRQRKYGADVISRVLRAEDGDFALMRDAIRGQIACEVAKLCDNNGVAPDRVLKIAVAGNTIMLHFLLGLSCRTLGRYPFTPVTLDHITIPSGDILDGRFQRCSVDVLPGFSAYVGADITAGVLMTGLHRAKEPALLLDLGTNGEMVLGGEGKLACTSAAAGPTFEGANILWGTGSIPGAISSVRCAPEGFETETISGCPAVGICGSGVIDAVYAFLQKGLLREDGRFNKHAPVGGIPLARTPGGEAICLTQRDVREFQLSKSAIRSGIDALMDHAGYRPADIGALYVAGGFGCKIRAESAAGIGMIPAELEDRIVPVGNSSLGGIIKYLLESGGREELSWATKGATEFTLSEKPSFKQIFIDNLSLKKY